MLSDGTPVELKLLVKCHICRDAETGRTLFLKIEAGAGRWFDLVWHGLPEMSELILLLACYIHIKSLPRMTLLAEGWDLLKTASGSLRISLIQSPLHAKSDPSSSEEISLRQTSSSFTFKMSYRERWVKKIFVNVSVSLSALLNKPVYLRMKLLQNCQGTSDLCVCFRDVSLCTLSSLLSFNIEKNRKIPYCPSGGNSVGNSSKVAGSSNMN